jgi:hypothetical protein
VQLLQLAIFGLRLSEVDSAVCDVALALAGQEHLAVRRLEAPRGAVCAVYAHRREDGRHGGVPHPQHVDGAFKLLPSPLY